LSSCQSAPLGEKKTNSPEVILNISTASLFAWRESRQSTKGNTMDLNPSAQRALQDSLPQHYGEDAVNERMY